ncbi:MAG: hypothetical protein NUV77_26925, partial [Thermoguttaceae bacterium]|nr:hypothetical protein [Thermoguttaceae bacterium]
MIARGILLVALLAGLVADRPAMPASPRPNLLPDGGLEGFGPDGLPQGFARYVYGAAPVIAPDTAIVHEGRRCLRISAAEPSDTAVSQDLMLTPGAVLRFSGWVRTEHLVPESRSWTHGTFQIQDSQGRPIARLKNHRGNTEWTLETVLFRVPADGKVRVACFFVGFGKGTGTAWFDDLRLEEAAPPDAVVVSERPLGRDPISPLLVGNFMELLSDLVPSMWAEQLDCTSFEFLRTAEERALRQSRFSFDPAWDPRDRLWRTLGGQGAEFVLDDVRPFNGAVSQRIRLAAGGREAGIAQDGIAVRQGESYRFVGHFRQEGLAGPVHLELRDAERLIAQAAVPSIGNDWARYEATLRPATTCTRAAFVVRVATPGTLWVDRVSLMPEKNVAGWRTDVVEAVRAMRPGIIRWGGSIIEGYSWRDGVGPWEKRVPFPNRYWGRIDPNFVGIDEFVAFCRAVDAEPLVCVRWTGLWPVQRTQ